MTITDDEVRRLYAELPPLKPGPKTKAPEERRSKLLPLRVTTAELVKVKAMAEADGCASVSEWQRKKLGL